MQYLQEHDKWVGDQMEDGHQPQLLLSLVSISRHSPTKGLEDQIRLARGGVKVLLQKWTRSQVGS